MNEYDQVVRMLIEQHDELKELRKDVAQSNVVLASQAQAVDDWRVWTKEAHQNRAAVCLRHDERLAELEKMATSLAASYQTLIKFGVGIIAVGTFVITAWAILNKGASKFIDMLYEIF